MTTRGADVVVVGGGLIGSAVAWRLAQDGARVVVADPDPGRAAAQVAAGMLAPVTEAHYTEPALVALMQASAARWPGFAAELAAASGADLGYDASGTLVVALDADDRAELDRLHRFLGAQQLPAEPLTASACRDTEPLLAPGVRGGLLVPGDHQVDPRRLMSALVRAGAVAGVERVRAGAVELLSADGRAHGVRLDDGSTAPGDAVVLANGAWSPLLGGLPVASRPPVRPVRGEVVRLRGPAGLLRRPVRALVHGTALYVVPRADGEVIVGATSEERGYDVSVTADGVYTLLRDLRAVLPALADLTVSELTAGLRPVTPDNAPIVAAVEPAGLVLATGHGRHGVLLAPVTAEGVRSLVHGGTGIAELAGFGLERFRRLESGVPA